MLHPMAEAALAAELGWWPPLADHTEYLPGDPQDLTFEPFADTGTDWGGGPHYPDAVYAGSPLRLGNQFVRSVSGVWVNPAAFGVDSLYTGDHLLDPAAYAVDPRGFLSGPAWPAVAQSVKVAYSAGLDQAALASPRYAPIKLAALYAIADAYKEARRDGKTSDTGAAGPLTSERWPDHAETYASPTSGLQAYVADAVITPRVRRLIGPFVRYGA